MALKDTFCSSPWFHIRLSHNGQLGFCRWGDQLEQRAEFEYDPSSNIRNIDPITFFQQTMTGFRKGMMDGIPQKKCSECYQVDKHDKISGRQRQLLKSGITLEHFEKSTLSSPMLKYFKADGTTDLRPVDWQIDLGNYCNSACIYCLPIFSSSLATEFKKIGFIDELPEKPWVDDPGLVDKFIKILVDTEHLAYLHFLGGETLITPGFKRILEKLVESGISQKTSIGFTTNLTVWDEGTNDLLSKFKEVNLGMSIECFHPVNDYLRYPSKIDQVREICLKWIELGRRMNWFMQFRITPTNLSIMELDTLYDFAYEHEIAVESCNFISEPACMRPSILPKDMREQAIKRLEVWINENRSTSQKIINTRNPSTIRSQILQDAVSYVNYLKTESYDTDKIPDLITYLKRLEANRQNSILDYLPEHEEFFRTAGY